MLALSRAGLVPRNAWVDVLHAWLPVVCVFLFGVLNGRQLDDVRQALLASREQAIVNLEQYRGLFRNAAEGIFRCNRQGLLLETNPSFLRRSGVRRPTPSCCRRSRSRACWRPATGSACVAS